MHYIDMPNVTKPACKKIYRIIEKKTVYDQFQGLCRGYILLTVVKIGHVLMELIDN
jgi:hypothetical protein